MPNLRVSELVQRTPDGTEFLEVIIPPFVPGSNRKVLLSEIFNLVQNHVRGAWSLAGDSYPSSGSGPGNAISAGDWWYVSVAGNLITTTGDPAQPILVRTLIFALVNNATLPEHFRVIQ